MGISALTYVEIDLDHCALIYGVAPCTAALGVTGDKKCFNTKFTCQDRLNFDNEPVTYRFSQGGRMYEPIEIDTFPVIVNISHNPGSISLGENLGVRSTVTITLKDFPYNDVGVAGDKYLADRSYDPLEHGTFFGRFRTRNRYILGKPLRILRGTVGDSLEAMTTRHYVVESFTGPDANGGFVIVAKDVLKLADNDRAKAPRPSNGYLSADISAVTTSIVLSPTGVGAEYPASGYVTIAGKEVVSFTRSSDTLTVVRAQYNTVGIIHKQNDRVQLAYRKISTDPADILYDLFVNYAGVDPDFISLPSWLTETTTYIASLYSGIVVEPTGVQKLINEIIEQAALVIWWDDIQQLIRLQVLRKIPANSLTFNEENTIEGSLSITEQPDKRLSQVYVYFNLRNPCEKFEEDNFQSSVLVFDGQRETDYGSAKIKTILSRWFPNGARAFALRLGDTQLARFKDPPRQLSWAILRGTDDVQLGGGYKIGSWALQDDEGAAELAEVQITQLRVDDTASYATAEEILFDYTDSGGGGTGDDRVIILDTNQNNVNLQTLHDSLFTPITTVGAITLTLIIDVGTIIGSANTTLPALDIGTFTVGLPITIQVKGRVQGAGGQGASGAVAGKVGGTALYTRQAITLDLTTDAGEVWGGGGGGGSGQTYIGGRIDSGGGGAGTVGGAAGVPAGAGASGSAGTSTAGGAGSSSGFNSGAGGDPGLPGSAGIGSPASGPGAAGNQIDGVSYVTVSGTGDRRGPTIN